MTTPIDLPLVQAHHRHDMMRDAMLERLDSAQPRGADFVAKLDADGSGDLTSTEIADSMLGKIMGEDAFAATDTDGNGALSVDELDARHGEVVATLTDALSSRADARSLFMGLIEE